MAVSNFLMQRHIVRLPTKAMLRGVIMAEIKTFLKKNLNLFICVFVLSFIISFMISNWNMFSNKDCYKTTAIIHNQWVGKLGCCCDNCLIFNVTEFVCKGNQGDGCGCEWKDSIWYFEREQDLREDLPNGSEIWVKWCLDKSENRYFIREVTKK